jgi:hypothetical protein
MMLITNELLMQVWEAVERINEKIVPEQESESVVHEAFIQGNFNHLEIRFMGSNLWNSEENDTTEADGIFRDAMEDLIKIRDAVAQIKEE